MCTSTNSNCNPLVRLRSMLDDARLWGSSPQSGMGEYRWRMSDITMRAVASTTSLHVCEPRPLSELWGIQIIIDDNMLFGEAELLHVEAGGSVL